MIKALALLLMLLTAVQPACAGTLREFEKDATTPSPEPKETREKPPRNHHEHDHDQNDNDSLGSIIGQLLLMPIVLGLGYGGIESYKRATGTSLTPREVGDPLIPLVRVDAGYQAVEHGIDALDLRGEAGYGPVAVQGRHTRYFEKGSSDTMSATQAHLLYRMSFGSKVECDLGLGAMVLDGVNTTSGFSFTFPVLVYPSPHYGVEFRPAWANLNGNSVDDYDLALIVGSRSLKLKLGYRWFLSEHQSLKGPQGGVVASW